MKDPIPTFSHIITAIRDRYPNFSYIHLVEPRISGPTDIIPEEGQTNEVFRKLWSPRPYLTAGGYTKDEAVKVAEEQDAIVVFGRMFISNVRPVHDPEKPNTRF